MTSTAVILPILAALNAAQLNFLGFDHTWKSTNRTQDSFITQYFPKTEELKKLSAKELSSCASENVDVVNAFLKVKGFGEMQLDDPGEGGFAIASVLDILCKFRVKGKKSSLRVNVPGTSKIETFPAVCLKDGYTLRRLKDGACILTVDCENGDRVCMIEAEKPLDGLELLEKIDSLSSAEYTDVTQGYDQVFFPMVDYNQKVDISWLEGMIYPPKWYISQAVQITRFQMNEEGAAAQSAVAIGISKTCIRINDIFTITKPFYLWIERPNMTLKLFAGYCDTDCWKEPKGLGKARL